MSRKRRRKWVNTICPFCNKYVYELPNYIEVGSEEYRRYWQTVETVETSSRIQNFHRTCYIESTRKGGKGLG